jgi:serine/threonine-protein kinase
MVVQRFVDEARAVNRIQHPNIVDIFGFGELPDGRKYCVMDLLQGVSLGERLHELGRMPPAEALEVLSEIASALDAAHAAGVVHRDLKPQNVFLSRTTDGKRRVTLLDFGLARMAGDDERLRTGNGVVLGTPAYMSPEQCAGVEVTHSTDVYALGVAAFELLTGRIPFTGTSFGALIAQHLTAPPPKPSSFVPSLSPRVDDVFAHWLAKSPEDRPPSASAAVQLLGAALVPKRLAGVWLGVVAVVVLLALLLWLR